MYIVTTTELPSSKNNFYDISTVLIQYRIVRDRGTDRQTDRRTSCDKAAVVSLVQPIVYPRRHRKEVCRDMPMSMYVRPLYANFSDFEKHLQRIFAGH